MPELPPPSPTKLFRGEHLFVTLKELVGENEWLETHRWNHGLEEDFTYPEGSAKWRRQQKRRRDSGDSNDSEEPETFTGERLWNHPHLPTVSVYGFMEVIKLLTADHILPDVPGENIEDIASTIIDHLVGLGQVTDENRDKAIAALTTSAQGSSDEEDEDSDGNNAWENDKNSGSIFHTRSRRASSKSSDRRISRASTSLAVDAEEFTLLDPDIEEEALEMLLANVDWVNEDVLVFCALGKASDVGVEMHSKARFRLFSLVKSRIEESTSKSWNLSLRCSKMRTSSGLHTLAPSPKSFCARFTVGFTSFEFCPISTVLPLKLPRSELKSF